MPRILLIEDEKVLRDNLRELIELNGLNIKTAANGEEALQMLSTVMPDLIICDIKMPGMSGYDVLDKVRSIPEFVAIPFIFLSAKVESEDIRTGMNLGADDYLTKPVTRHDLLSAIHSRLKRADVLRDSAYDNIKSRIAETINVSVADVEQRLDKLSRTEKKIVQLIADGRTSPEIAESLFISPKTVENHRYNISRKLGLKGAHSVLSFALTVKPLLAHALKSSS